MTNDELPGRFPQLRALFRNLKAGLRGVFFLRLPLRDDDANWTQLALFVLLGLGIQFAWDVSRVGVHGELVSYGLPGALFSLPVLLLAAWILAAVARQSHKTLQLAVVFFAIGVPFAALTPTLYWLPWRASRFLMLWSYSDFPPFTFWYAVACGVAAMRIVTPPRRIMAIAGFLLVLVAIGLPLQTPRNSSLWAVPFDRLQAREEMRQRHALDQEAVFYLQPKLLQQELDGVVPQRHEGINLYFVGVAGYADQDVFTKEIKYVDKLFQERFGTAGHSILLVNNPKTVTQLPIASATSIGLALKKVGDSMDRDKDILFLYMTSHGSRDHKFSLDFGEMKFDDLDPPRLRKLLDESGIKHRVIVVGACYSGGFVDAVKGDDTLVITSAAPDRTSFGCSDEEDFTYFGRAYFADALAHTDSFVDAFTLAKPIVAAREKEDDYTPSDPRIAVGTAIRGTLEEFSRQQRAARLAQNVMKYKLRPDIVAAPVAALAQSAVPGQSSVHERKTPEDEHLEAARALMELIPYREMIQEGIEHCQDYGKSKDSAEKVYEKNHDAFHGLTPKSAGWPKLVGALNRYWEKSCAPLQVETYQDVMTHSLAAGMTEQEIEEAVKYLSTSSGRSFLKASLSASKSLESEINDRAKVEQQKALDEYNKTLAELVAADPVVQRTQDSHALPWWHLW
jgi:hypothetical protein